MSKAVKMIQPRQTAERAFNQRGVINESTLGLEDKAINN